MTRALFLAVLKRAAASWRAGDAAAAADCFAEDVEYLDPYRFRFTRRADLLPFFEPPTGGHHVIWHSILWDDEAQTGVVEYTYEGDHRYHGAAIVRLDADGRIALWREWQHQDDELDWDSRLRGPREGGVITAIDHVQLSMPAGGEGAARTFYADALGLDEIRKPRQLAGRGGAWFASGTVAVHLGVDVDFRPATRAHPAFVVDLAAVRARLADAGITVEDDDSGLPVKRCYVRDPFGNRVELVDASGAGFSLQPSSDGNPL